MTDRYDLYTELESVVADLADLCRQPENQRRITAQFEQSGRRKWATRARHAKRSSDILFNGAHRRRLHTG